MFSNHFPCKSYLLRQLNENVLPAQHAPTSNTTACTVVNSNKLFLTVDEVRRRLGLELPSAAAESDSGSFWVASLLIVSNRAHAAGLLFVDQKRV